MLYALLNQLRRLDLNQRPSAYGADELTKLLYAARPIHRFDPMYKLLLHQLVRQTSYSMHYGL